ncbi:hypothetical protein WA158_003973 [Blastocystis sp. Blastoise]
MRPFTSLPYGQNHIVNNLTNNRGQYTNNNNRIFVRYHGDHSHADDPVMQTKEAKKITYVGLGINVALSAGKGAVGIIANSSAILADAAHSLGDLLSDFVTLGAVSFSRKKCNDKYPFGYGKIESLASFLVGAILVGTAGGIFVHAFHALTTLYPSFFSSYLPFLIQTEVGHVHSHVPEIAANTSLVNNMSYGILLASMASKEWIYQLTERLSKKLNSPVLHANAWHHRTDALTSVIALIGVAGRVAGYPVLDPIMGMIVGYMTLDVGVRTCLDVLNDLTDKSIKSEQLEAIRAVAIKNTPDYLEVKNVIARKSGPHIHTQVTLGLKDQIHSVDDILNVSHILKEEIHELGNIQRVIVDFEDSQYHNEH